MYSVKIITTDKEINLENLSEQDTINILKNVYNSVERLSEYIKFTDDIKIFALDLDSFYIC